MLSASGVRWCIPAVLATNEKSAAPLPSAYGMLLDVSDVKVDVDRIVQSWVFRGVGASFLYAAALMALAITTVLHMNADVQLTFIIDSLEAFLMCVCKLTVGVCAHHIHRRLSRLSRSITGVWVLVVAIAMDIMAGCALVLTVIYMWVELEIRSPNGSLCVVGHVFCWSLLLSMALQSCAAFALFRIQERAAICVSDQRAFSRIIGNHWSVLVSGTFGVGVGLWVCGALFIFAPMLSLDPLEWMGLWYLFAAGCQGAAGLSMLSINNAVRKFFQSPEGKAAMSRAMELAACVVDEDVIGMCSS